MVGKRKITPEIAHFIRTKHKEGYRHGTIHQLVQKRFDIELSVSNVPRYYQPLGVVMQKTRKANERRRTKERQKDYDTRYHRLRRCLWKYLQQMLNEPQRLSTLSDKLAECAKRNPRIDRAIHLRKATLERIINDYMTNVGRAPPLYKIGPGVYTLKE